MWAFDFVFGAWVDGLLAERLPTQNTGAFFQGKRGCIPTVDCMRL